MERILVVEDDRRMNEIICDYLEMEGYGVIAAYDGVEAMDIFEKESIDMVILDIMMPKMDGWAVCRRIRKSSDAIIMILSARSEEEDKLLGYDLGADEYVTKPFSPKVLVARIKALSNLAGKKNVNKAASTLLQKGQLFIDTDSYIVTTSGTPVSLTVKEFEILKVLAQNEGKVFTRSALIDQIWGYGYYGDGRVVDTTIKTLRKKLGSLSSYIVTVIGVGYKLEL